MGHLTTSRPERDGDDVLAGLEAVVPPVTNVGAPDESAYVPPSLSGVALRRRPGAERRAA